MKALVLCAGLGTRLRPFTLTTAKHLLPVANKPVLVHVLEALRAVGAADVGIVVNGQSRPPIEAAIGDGSKVGVRTAYIEQAAPKGLAHAVACGREFVAGESFLLYLADTLLPEGLAGLVSTFSAPAAAAVMLKPVDDPQRFGIAVVEQGRVVRLVEKPREPPSNLAIAGAYAFSGEIFASIERIRPSWRGELEITDAMQDLIDRGFEVRAHISSGWWKDAATPQDVIDANSAMLETLEREVHGHVDAASLVVGSVVVGRNARIAGSVVRGPAIIGEGAVVEDADVGPHVSIGDRALVRRAVVRESVVMSEAVIDGVDRALRRCLIGHRAEVRGGGQESLILGDFSSVVVK